MKYKSKRWINKRAYILMRDKHMCQECLRFGRTTPAEMVHHIYPAEEEESLRYKDFNLVSLCNRCHNKMHNRDSDTLTSSGEQWKSLVRRQYNKEKETQ